MSDTNPTKPNKSLIGNLLFQLEEMERDGQLEFWHSGNNAFVTFKVGNHRENWPVDSQTFRLRLTEITFNTTGRTLSDTASKELISTLKAKARFSGPEYPANYRVGKHKGCIFIDLGDDSWTSIEVNSEGWRIVKKSPIRFWRTEHSRGLPIPDKGSGIEIFLKYLNVSSQNDLLLILSFMAQALLPPGPYPVLSISGEQGSAKSTAARFIVSLVDPKAAPLRPMPGNERDLMIDASQSMLLAFDNISNVKTDMSDALCRLSSGGGFSTRKLYKNSDLMVFEAQRPVVLTGINETARRGDLVDRSVSIKLNRIVPEKRLSESALNESLISDMPKIFGCLLDIVSGCLKEKDNIRLVDPPRMIDFAIIGESVAKFLGMDRGTFLNAFNGSQTDANQDIVDGSSIGEPLRVFIGDRKSWTGKAGELLSLLKNTQEEEITRRKGWPKDAARLSRELRRLSPSLRLEGVNVEFDTPSRRLITITRITETTDTTVTSTRERSGDDCANQSADVGTTVNVADNIFRRSVFQEQVDAFDSVVSKKRYSPEPCNSCGGRKFWETDDQVILCGTCHPNPNRL